MLKHSPLALAVVAALCTPLLAVAEQATELESVVVTAPTSKSPLTVKFNPKAPQQPLPAHDGAAFLKNISGMSVIRKGGTDGDPVFRGMSGSRLGVLLDGQEVYGGCSGRMDPPTAYVYPESYDRVTLMKGPQTVKYGAGFSAGVVNFERKNQRLAENGASGHASVTLGSAGRNDVVLDGKVGTPNFYIKGGATRADADDYKDGDGKTIHSAYARWSANTAMGWTPDDDTLLELSLGRSDGKADYADRMMDGVKFDRESKALKFERKNVSARVSKVEGEVYDNYVDHVMDNYSRRTNTGTSMMSHMVANPDRSTQGGRVSTTLNASEKTQVTLGADAKQDKHTSRSGMGMTGAAADAMYQAATRAQDMQFKQSGVFGEVKHTFNERSRVVSGLRVDQHKATDSRSKVGMMGMVANDTQGAVDNETLRSGFVRYERDAATQNRTYYASVGHTERTPDYWERNQLDPTTGKSAFLTTKPEKTNQLDVGMNWKKDKLSGSVSAFYNKIDNYQLIDWTGGMAAGKTHNVKATTHGVEADVAYQVNNQWKGTATLAHVHGDNKTDHKPLAQQPPTEVRLGAEYDNGKHFFGVQERLVAGQKRVDPGYGSIVVGSKDVAPTAGFGVFSINGGTRPKKGVTLSTGIDNVFDKKYVEHVSQNGTDMAIPGYATTDRVNEPGRTVWVKASFDLD